MAIPSERKDFFISYTGADVAWAQWMAEQLEAEGYTTVYQARDFTAGGNFVVQMHEAMRQTKRTIAVLTPEYLTARFTLPEWAEAFRRDPTGEYAILVPVRVKPCDVNGVLGARVYIDLVGMDATAASTRLVEQIRHLDGKALPSAAPAPFPGTASQPAQVIAPTGLPRAVSLVGRDEVLAELMEKLRAGTTSGVFALEGMGGVGKTALAAEAVARLAEDLEAFPGGAAWIACESLVGEAGLAELWAKVALTLGLEPVMAQSDPQRRRMMLSAALAQGQRVLLALDNVEPGLDAEAVLETLAVRNHTALLLTARQRVVPQRVAAIDLAPLLLEGARTLFLEQLARNGGTQPTPAEEPALAALIAAVGGLPLALELTAAYAGVQRLKVESVLREVEQDGLNAAAFRADPKRALLKRFERSWRVLSRRQQRLFAGLSLLAGASFPREAALALGHATVAKRAADPAGDLLTLVSYALVEALPGGERLRLHPLLREYAAEKVAKLPKEQGERMGEAMVVYWLAYAEAHPDYEEMDSLEVEAAGLMGALAWSHEHELHPEVLALTHALSQFWFVRGLVDEARKARVWALKAATELHTKEEERWARHELAVLDAGTGRPSEARANFERALELAQQIGDLAAEWIEVHSLAVLDSKTGRPSEARAGFVRSLELTRLLSGGLAAQQAEVHELATLDAQTGRLLAARKGFQQALALAMEIGDPAARCMELYGLAALDDKMGWPAEARLGFELGLAVAREIRNLAGEQLGVYSLAVLDSKTGRPLEAQTGFEQALELARQLHDPAAEAVGCCNFGDFLSQRGEPDRGCDLMNQGLSLSKQLGDVYLTGKCHQFLGNHDLRQGNHDSAVAHYREALQCLEQVQSPEAEVVREALRELGEEG